MRVAFTHTYCWPDVLRGGERFLHELAAATARRGHDVTIISGSYRPGVTVEDGVRVVRLPLPAGEGLAQEYRFGKTLFPRLVMGRYDIVHSLGPADAAASIYAARVHPRRRTVYTHLGIPVRSYYEQQPDWRWHRLVAKRIDVYGCMSRHAARMLQEGFGREAALTPGGVQLARFTVSQTRAAHPTLLYAGALTEPRKHVDDLLVALALLARDVPDVRLRLVGTGDPTELLCAAPVEARERTDVVASGTPDIAQEYANAWATVLPSVNEAFGIVLLESLACGTPIVVCDDSAPPELVEPGAGTIAQPRDPVSLAQACRAAIDLCRAPGIESRCRAAAEPYDWDRGIAPAVEALYTDGATT